MSRALWTGDVEAILDRTHLRILALMGGRAAARKITLQALESVRSSEMKLLEMTFPAPPTFVSGTDDEFVVVPTRSVVVTDGKRILSLNYQFGARPIGSKVWKYIDGSRVNQSNVRSLFPDFPRNFEFPPVRRELEP